MRAAGLLDGWGDYPRRRVEAEFRRVLRFEDEIETRILAERVGTSSITYVWTIAKEGETFIEGRHTVVHVGIDGRPVPLPEKVRSALSP
jgi:acyl-CoA thioesterase FadM